LKIAILGSAPSSLPLAPFDDKEWTIWGCSPGASPHAKRADAWFELHAWNNPALTPEYRAFLARQAKVYMIQPVVEVSGSVAYPLTEVLAEFGRYFFTSTPAWMIALAIQQKPEAIGLWGIDMSAQGEYDFQRPGCQHFLEIAQQRGIQVTCPAESDLLEPPPLYGFSEADPMQVKWQVREMELKARRAALEQQIESARNESLFLAGALDNHAYIQRTWSQRR
jgi:hypothetical protein